MKDFFDFLSNREIITTVLGYYLAGCFIEHKKDALFKNITMIILSIFVAITGDSIESGVALFLGYLSDPRKIKDIVKNRFKK